MKITFFIGSISGGGAEHVICDLASNMAQRGHECEILIVSNTDRSYSIDSSVSIKSLDTKDRVSNKHLRTAIKMIRLLRYVISVKPDLYVVFLPETIRAIMMFRGIVHSSIVVSERSNPEAYDKITFNHMLNAFKKADAMVFQTEQAKNYYLKRMSVIPTCYTIPNAITNSETRPFVGQRKKKIVAAGRFKPEKNFPLLIQSFAIVSKSYKDYVLEIYGEGELLTEYVKLVEELDISDKVFFPGFVDNISDYIKDAEIFVLSSNYEGMPNALIEAMALGLSCVATRCKGGAAEYLIKDGYNGYLVPIGNVEAMSKTICKLISNHEIRESISNNATHISKLLSPEVVYDEWEYCFEECINRKGNESP